jgi:hypothetical protein
MDGWMIRIERPWLSDDVDRLHVKIDNLNDTLTRLYFIRGIDLKQSGKRARGCGWCLSSLLNLIAPGVGRVRFRVVEFRRELVHRN